MDRPVSIAVETSCRRGDVALGAGAELLESVELDSQRGHSVELVPRLDALLRSRRLQPKDLDEVYVSVGPGSFTGLRVGITVARALAQVVPHLRCVAVPTIEAVAENASDLDFRHLGVVMDAKDQTVYIGVFARQGGRIAPLQAPWLVQVQRLPGQLPRPITLIGEGLWHQRIEGEGITIGDESLWLPSAGGVWRVGRRMAVEGRFTELRQLRPVYLRKPEAVRLWEKRRDQERNP